jgi:hypothetical protein
VTKTDLHRLVDALPDGSIEPVARLLERAKDPVMALLDAAPWDDEPFTEEDRAAVEASLADSGPSIPWEHAKKDLAAD